MSNDANHTPEYLVELAAAGELDPESRRAVVERASREQGGGDPVAALAHDDAAILARHTPQRVVAEVIRRAGTRRRRARWLAITAIAATGAAAIAIVAVPKNGQPRRADLDDVRVKGLSPHLVVHRRTPAGAERIASGGKVRAGDLVQLGYVAAGRPFGVIVSVDGGGAVTRHWPETGDAAAPLVSGREVLLPESFRLDAAPRFERFILVTAERPFHVASVLEATRELATRLDARDAPLGLAPGMTAADVVLSKEKP